MSLGGLSLLFIGAVLLHNTEEALRLPRWSTRGLSWYPRLTRRPFVFAVCVLSLVLIACAAAAAWAGPDSVAAYLFVGYAFAMAANAVVPHLVGSLAARSLMPGTLSGLLLNLPLGVALVLQAIDQRFVQPATLWWAAPVVAVALAASIRPLLWLGGRFCADEPDDTMSSSNQGRAQ